MTLKNGKHLSVDCEMNQLRVATCPNSICTFLLLHGGSMFIMDSNFSGLASISCSETMKPRNFLNSALEAHFSVLSFILYQHKTTKASHKSGAARAFSS